MSITILFSCRKSAPKNTGCLDCGDTRNVYLKMSPSILNSRTMLVLII
jgi:hypothetical protein